MEYRQLGSTGARVSSLVLGAATFGEIADQDEVDQIVDAAVEAGINAIDTGNVYAQGRSEEHVGRALKRHRDRLLVFTKVGMRVGDTIDELATGARGLHDPSLRWEQGISPNDAGLSRVHIRRAIEDSLRRLGVDHLDLYQVHSWDPRTPIHETLGVLDDLIREGKIRYIGCSSFAGWQLTKSLWAAERGGLTAFATMQTSYNLVSRRPELDPLPACVDAGVGVLAFQPLAGGLLTGRYQADREPEPGSRMALRPTYRAQYFSPEVFAAVDALRAVAVETDRSIAELALGWLLSNPSVNAVLVGADRPEELRETVRIADRPLTDDEWTAVDAAAAHFAVGRR
jgi:1-deoxyxylulose-5-phosphate synthase